MKRKILIVEDDPMIMKMIQIILEGYELLAATDGMTGVNMAKEDRPCVILMDLTLPFLDGYEALKEIRSFSDTIPVIAMTAKKTPLSEIKEKGFDDYLEKPFDPMVLLEKIEFFTV